MVIVNNVNKKYDDYKGFTLGPLGFSLEPGYIVGVIGKNGSGKSTLFRCLFGIEDFKGNIDGIDKMELSFVTDDCLFPQNYSPKQICKCFSPMYEQFDMVRFQSICEKNNVPMNKPIRKMSKGMSVVVQMAFAFSKPSKLLVVDEATAHLDAFARDDFYKLIAEYMLDENHTVFWASHIMEELAQRADYVLGLKDGRQAFFCEKDELLDRYSLATGSTRQFEYIKKAIVGRKKAGDNEMVLIDNTIETIPLSVSKERAKLGDIVEYLL